jgi:asparagine synthase (glutamine-hydrolysing)
VVGYINNLDEIRIKYKIRNKNDNEVIERLFSLKGKNAANELDGVFSVFIYDENAEKAYLFQDEYGSNLPIYYVNLNKEFIFSTSLKVILKNVPIRKELDYAAVYDLLSFQTMIPNESTLIRDIYKLPPQKIMVFDFKYNSFKIEPLKRNEEKISLSTAKVNLIKSIENNLARLFKHITVERLALALSSGYDSNFILFSLRS